MTTALLLVIMAGCIFTAVVQQRIVRQAREHRQDHDRINALLAGGRVQPPANMSWHCPACGANGIGHIPEGIDVSFGCPLCGVQAEITRGSVDVR